MKEKKLFIFDLGGVVFTHSFDKALRYWADKGKAEFSEIKRKYKQDEMYALHEVNKISIDQYAEHVSRLLGLTISKEDFIAGWNSIFMDEITGVRDLLKRLGKKHLIAALSNTNDTHCRFMSEKYRDALSVFPKIYFSHEVGARKPEKEIFLRALADHGAKPSETVFFDDVEENLDGARRVGLDTVLVTGYDSIAAGLAEYVSL